VSVALAHERARTQQSPPQYSAIKIAGRAAYARARAGEQFVLGPRSVAVLELRCAAVMLPPADASTDATGAPGPESAALELDLTVSKGYYVRALARDLGLGLGLPAHLRSLRRLRSGSFELARAVPLDADRDAWCANLIPLEEAARLALPAATLDVHGEARAAVGKAVALEHFSLAPPAVVPSAWFDPLGRLVAVGELGSDGRGRVLRGFARRDGPVAPSPRAR
jgi:tRNA pseudouridine55 synthase